MQADPIGYAGGMNMYNYVNGDPINYTDPSGLISQGFTLNWSCASGCGTRSSEDPWRGAIVGRSDIWFGSWGGSKRRPTTDSSKIDNDINVDKSKLAAFGSGFGFNDLNGSGLGKIENSIGSFGAAIRALITISNGIAYFATRSLAEDALINAIVAATRLTGNEHSSILFYDPNRAADGQYAYSHTDLIEGGPSSVDIGGAIPIGARALASYHSHNISSVPSGAVDIGFDANVLAISQRLGIPAYVVGLDSIPRIIRSTGYY